MRPLGSSQIKEWASQKAERSLETAWTQAQPERLGVAWGWRASCLDTGLRGGVYIRTPRLTWLADSVWKPVHASAGVSGQVPTLCAHAVQVTPS